MDETRITIAEYAALVGRDRSRVLRKAQAGDFQTAKREQIGALVVWTIDRGEEYTDKRVKKEPRG